MAEESLVYVDGVLLPESEAKISVFDHGVLYGDGVFEGIRAYNGFVFKLEKHLRRLYNSAGAIFLEIPLSMPEMREAVLETLRANRLREAYIRLVVTRGKGALGLSPFKCSSPTVVIIAKQWKTLYPARLYKSGLRAVVVVTRNKTPESIPSRVKSLNYLPNILAFVEAHASGVDEAIMLDIHGNVSEGSADNIFLVWGNQICTPLITNCLPGITRSVVLELARKRGNSVWARDLMVSELYIAEEVFLTGTAAEIVPIMEIDGHKIGKGIPGPVTTAIMEDFRKITRIPETGVQI